MAAAEHSGDPLIQEGRLYSGAPVTPEAVDLIKIGGTALFWTAVNAAADGRGAIGRWRSLEPQFNWVTNPDGAFIETTSTLVPLTDPETGQEIVWATDELGRIREQADAPVGYTSTMLETYPDVDSSRRLLRAQANVSPPDTGVLEKGIVYVRFDGTAPAPSELHRRLAAGKWAASGAASYPILTVIANENAPNGHDEHDHFGHDGMDRLFSAIYRAAID